jgi:hypothetical protein
MWNAVNVFALSARGTLHPERGGNMSGETDKAAWEDDYEMKPEYDFSESVPNPYAVRFGEGTAIVVLEPDVSVAFPDSASVNEALRLLIKAAKSAKDLPKAS